MLDRVIPEITRLRSGRSQPLKCPGLSQSGLTRLCEQRLLVVGDEVTSLDFPRKATIVRTQQASLRRPLPFFINLSPPCYEVDAGSRQAATPMSHFDNCHLLLAAMQLT